MGWVLTAMPDPGAGPNNARVSADLVPHGPVPPGSGEGYDVAVLATAASADAFGPLPKLIGLAAATGGADRP